MSKEITQLKRDRAKWELSIKLLSLLATFKSNQEPEVFLTEQEKTNVLAQLIVQKTQNK